jgi:hypothetical protein
MQTQRATLWVALMSLAAGATLLHYRAHAPGGDPTNLWPNLFSLIDLVLVSALFGFRGTALLGLLLNSFLVFLGIIMMADYSLAATLASQVKVRPGVDFFGWLLLTTFPYIMMALADFLTGLALYRAILVEKQGDLRVSP